MTLPIHTVKHVKADYRKYQVIAILFAAITLASAMIAAVSGIQLSKLQKKEAAARQSAVLNSPADVALVKEMEQLKSELEAEKAKSKEINAMFADLQKKIAAALETPTTQSQPIPNADEGSTASDSPGTSSSETRPIPVPPGDDTREAQTQTPDDSAPAQAPVQTPVKKPAGAPSAPESKIPAPQNTPPQSAAGGESSPVIAKPGMPSASQATPVSGTAGSESDQPLTEEAFPSAPGQSPTDTQNQ